MPRKDRTVGTEVMSEQARPREPRQVEYIGGFAANELLNYLRKLEAHGFGEVTVSAHQGRFRVSESKTYTPKDEQAQLVR